MGECTSQVDASGNTCLYSNSNAHHNFDLAIEESYSYDLWDQDKTMGCKCDPVYYGPDCSSLKCKYGTDPLFLDDTDGQIHQTSIINLSTKDRAGQIGGTFKIVFRDVFGEKYSTKAIDATAATADQAKTSAVQVSLQKEKGSLAKAGTIGAGLEGGSPGIAGTRVSVNDDGSNNLVGTDGGAGFGAWGNGGTVGDVGYGPQFTITFATNPGVLRTIELDTRQVTNQGKTDYWVANARQGQFSSRYSTNVGRIQTLRYGSKLVYTNHDWRTVTPANTLVKVGGQETIVTAVHQNVITLY